MFIDSAVCIGQLIEFVQSDLLGALRHWEYRPTPTLIDILVFNPPYVPSESDELGLECSWAPRISAAWAGGVAGREVIDRLLPQLPKRMAPGGIIYMVLEALNRPSEVAETLAKMGFEGHMIRETKVEHKEAPEHLFIWRFVNSSLQTPEPELAENQQSENRPTLADLNLPPAPAVDAVASGEEDDSTDTANRVLLLHNIPQVAGLRDVRQLLGWTPDATKALNVVYRIDETTVAAEYQDRNAALAASQLLQGAELRVGKPVSVAKLHVELRTPQ